jgi:hypothetical protein
MKSNPDKLSSVIDGHVKHMTIIIVECTVYCEGGTSIET